VGGHHQDEERGEKEMALSEKPRDPVMYVERNLYKELGGSLDPFG